MNLCSWQGGNKGVDRIGEQQNVRLRHSLGEEPRQRPEPAFRTLPSGSGPGQVAAGSALCSRTLPGPGGEANDVLESYC